MTKAKIAPPTNSDSPLLLVRLKELDREFTRQTKQLTAITKQFGKKIARIPNERGPRSTD